MRWVRGQAGTCVPGLERAQLTPCLLLSCWRVGLQGVKKVVVSAPVKDPQPVLNIVYG